MEGTSKVVINPNVGTGDGKTITSPTGGQTNAEEATVAPVPEVPETPAAPVEDLDEPYIEKRTITINVIKNPSLFRRANDKYMPRKVEYIGSSIRSSSVLTSNKQEIEYYFPSLLGVPANHDTFITRVKQYLNNFHIEVNELGKTLDISFRWNTKRDYLAFKAKEDRIEDTYKAVRRDNLVELKKALEVKIDDLNNLESTRFRFGNPINVEDYIKYRHCLLYKDVCKDPIFINSDISYRFYFKDDVREQEQARKRRIEANNAKRNYLLALGDDETFRAVYIQYCVANNQPVLTSILKDKFEQESELDRYSTDEPAKFNKMFNDKDLKIKAFIETLIARGEFIRATDNQNISTPAGEFIGANMKEAVLWYKNPENASTVEAYKNKLKY